MATTTSCPIDERLLLLDPDDDCAVARAPLPAGTMVQIAGEQVSIGIDLGVGHKIAVRDLASGDRVRKSGAVVGRTTRAVATGEHLHLHNLRSDYMQAHLVGGQVVGSAATESEPSGPTTADVAVPAAKLASTPGAPGVPRSSETRAPRLPEISGYLRADGRKGIRNHLLVVYTVECAHHVTRRIADTFDSTSLGGVQVVGFPGCYPNEYAQRVLSALCTHPNVGGALVVSLGCESFDARTLVDTVRESGRWVDRLVIQEEGGTSATIARGRALVAEGLAAVGGIERVPMVVGDLVVGTICGGSDSTSLLTANPAVGRAFDHLVTQGARCIFEETGELIGCEEHLRARATDPELGEELVARVRKAAAYYEQLGHASIAPGNLAGGLTTIEEKSIGAYAKSGSSPITGVIEPGAQPAGPGLYLLDIVSDGPARFGYPNINDTTEIVELIACGSHVILFTTGRGSVVGSVVSPVVKVCANPETFRKMPEDMDVDAGRILTSCASLDEVGLEIYERLVRTAAGEPTCSEALGHQEFQLGYKVFGSIEPSCLA